MKFHTILTRKIAHLGWWLLITLSILLAINVSGSKAQPITPDPVTNSPSAVLQAHSTTCWTGSAPADATIPGHVIWQHPNGTTVYSKRLVGPALDTVFADGNLPGRPIAFCR